MANPNIPQGTLNRLIASIVWNDFPALNITPPYLMPEGIDLAFEGQATAMLPSMTGLITSPEPFLSCRIMIHLLKSQALSNAYKQQMETSVLMGPCTIRPDSPTIDPYLIDNCSITGLNQLNFSGRDGGFTITIMGAYYLNSNLWL